jgi:hypothetical protein
MVIFKPKIPIWVSFGVSCNGKCWYIICPFGLFTAIWSIIHTAIRYILWSFGVFYGHKVYFWPFGIVLVIWYISWPFGIFVTFWFVVPRKIWQHGCVGGSTTQMSDKKWSNQVCCVTCTIFKTSVSVNFP